MNRNDFLKGISALAMLPMIPFRRETDYVPVGPVEALEDEFKQGDYIEIWATDSDGNVITWTKPLYNSDGSENPIILEGLAPDTEYDVQFRYVYSGKHKPWSEPEYY